MAKTKAKGDASQVTGAISDNLLAWHCVAFVVRTLAILSLITDGEGREIFLCVDPQLPNRKLTSDASIHCFSSSIKICIINSILCASSKNSQGYFDPTEILKFVPIRTNLPVSY